MYPPCIDFYSEDTISTKKTEIDLFSNMSNIGNIAFVKSKL